MMPFVLLFYTLKTCTYILRLNFITLFSTHNLYILAKCLEKKE